MIDFHTPTLEDKAWIEEKIKESGGPSCEYTFGNIFSYTAKMEIKVALYENCLVTRCVSDDAVMYAYPLGNGNRKKAIESILAKAKKDNENFHFFGMTNECADELERFFPEKFNIRSDRDGFDYIYLTEDLVNLKGRKYQPKRNHISFFKRNYNWSYEKITQENISECIAMNEKWIEKNESDFKNELEDELKIIRKVFENYDALGFVGGLIRIDGEVIAYAMGEKMNEDTFCVHFEKAFSEYRGSYAMINRELCLNELTEYKYVDREDDVGAENLRKAKLSYYPVILKEEYEATLK
ncbi:MAG: DUF2156 domain-containing protein [Acutalibacteraceae bacterium]